MSKSAPPFPEFESAIKKYEQIVSVITSELKNPTRADHFDYIRSLLNELELLDSDLSKSSVVREKINNPDI